MHNLACRADPVAKVAFVRPGAEPPPEGVVDHWFDGYYTPEFRRNADAQLVGGGDAGGSKPAAAALESSPPRDAIRIQSGTLPMQYLYEWYDGQWKQWRLPAAGASPPTSPRQRRASAGAPAGAPGSPQQQRRASAGAPSSSQQQRRASAGTSGSPQQQRKAPQPDRGVPSTPCHGPSSSRAAVAGQGGEEMAEAGPRGCGSTGPGPGAGPCGEDSGAGPSGAAHGRARTGTAARAGAVAWDSQAGASGEQGVGLLGQSAWQGAVAGSTEQQGLAEVINLCVDSDEGEEAAPAGGQWQGSGRGESAATTAQAQAGRAGAQAQAGQGAEGYCVGSDGVKQGLLGRLSASAAAQGGSRRAPGAAGAAPLVGDAGAVGAQQAAAGTPQQACLGERSLTAVLGTPVAITTDAAQGGGITPMQGSAAAGGYLGSAKIRTRAQQVSWPSRLRRPTLVASCLSVGVVCTAFLPLPSLTATHLCIPICCGDRNMRTLLSINSSS